MRSLIYRAYRICSSEMLFNECYSTIESIFINNGYHYSYIEKIKRKTIENYIKNQQKSQQTPQTNADTKNTKYITLTYIKENENKIRKVAKLIEDTIGKDKIQIRTAYKTKKTQSFFSNKDKIPTDIRSNIVYSYNCDQCPGLQYIKESVRHFSTPKNEHINGDSNPTEVTTHIHTAKEENFSIVIQSKHTTIAESLVYHSVPPSKRLNKYHPPYQLQLFDCDTNEEAMIDTNML